VNSNGRVFLSQSVTAGNNKGLPTYLDHAYYAMSAKAPVARVESDVPRPHGRVWLPLNQKKVTGKN
jgi:hypothetical protein